MTELSQIALLPAGLHDALPPEAALEAAVIERMVAVLASHGYDRVKPPLVEFEESLLTGAGAALAKETFRLMDPVSQRMMGLRADMTIQIARIATTRLGRAPRPLRLSYAGQVLRVKGTQLRPERQFAQVGAELIGSLLPTADAEVVALAARALSAAGVKGLSVDLCVPTLVPVLCQALDVPADTEQRLRAALDRKDTAEVAAIGGRIGALAEKLIRISGPADQASTALAELDLPEAVEPDRRRLLEVVRLLRDRMPGLTLTVDLVERRGFEYQTGLSFTLFARGVRGELGRGGRYRAGLGTVSPEGEPAAGFTLFLDSVLRAVPNAAPARRVLMALDAPEAEAEALRAEGWVTVAALRAEDGAEEARRLGCSHVWRNGAIHPV